MRRTLRKIAKSARKTAVAELLLGPAAPCWIEASDEFTTWLRYANAGMTHSGNQHAMEHAIKNLPSAAPIVEIGSFCGLSTNLLTYYVQKHRRRTRVIACDRWDFENKKGVLVGESAISHEEYREFVKETYIRNIRMFSRPEPPHTLELTSDEFFAAWRRNEERTDVLGRAIRLGGPIGFCFIDGNHTYAYAKRDFENSGEFVERGGFVLLDDSSDDTAFPGLRQLVQEIIASNGYEMTMKNPNYMFQKR